MENGTQNKTKNEHFIKSFSIKELEIFKAMIESFKNEGKSYYDFANNEDFMSLKYKMLKNFSIPQELKLKMTHQKKEKESFVKIKEAIEKLKNENIEITASKLIEETKLNKNTIYKFYDVKNKCIKEKYSYKDNFNYSYKKNKKI